jgi:hypothetical protein
MGRITVTLITIIIIISLFFISSSSLFINLQSFFYKNLNKKIQEIFKNSKKNKIDEEPSNNNDENKIIIGQNNNSRIEFEIDSKNQSIAEADKKSLLLTNEIKKLKILLESLVREDDSYQFEYDELEKERNLLLEKMIEVKTKINSGYCKRNNLMIELQIIVQIKKIIEFELDSLINQKPQLIESIKRAMLDLSGIEPDFDIF